MSSETSEKDALAHDNLSEDSDSIKEFDEPDSSNNLEEEEAAKPVAVVTPPPPPKKDVAEDDPEEVEAKRQKRLIKRQKILEEIVSTEATYLKHLTWIIERYKNPLDNRALCNISERKHNGLFPQVINSFFQLNSILYDDVNLQVNNPEASNKSIGKIFLGFAPYFRMYKEYVTGFDDIRKTYLRVRERNPAFVAFEAERKAECENLDLNSLLITPIQRPPRYELLLRDLIKYTDEGHEDYKCLLEAFDKIKGVNAEINISMTEFENREKVREIENEFAGNVSLVEPSRRFVKRGLLTKKSRKNDQPYEFILFSDCLIYGKLQVATGQYNLHQKIPIDRVFAMHPKKDDKHITNGWLLNTSVKSFEVYASTAEEKTEWMEALESCREVVRQQIGIDDDNVTVRAAWKPDVSSKLCIQCHEPFTFLRRRHHCRQCGELVCGNCSPYKLAVKKGSKKKERCCNLCHSDYESIRTGTPEDQTRSGQLPTIPSFVYYAKEEYEAETN